MIINVSVTPKLFKKYLDWVFINVNVYTIPDESKSCYSRYSGDQDKILYTLKLLISHTSVGNNIVDHLDVVGATPGGAALTTSSFST